MLFKIQKRFFISASLIISCSIVVILAINVNRPVEPLTSVDQLNSSSEASNITRSVDNSGSNNNPAIIVAGSQDTTGREGRLLDLAHKDIKNALAFIDLQFPPQEKEHALSWLIGELGKNDLSICKAWIPHLTSSTGRQVAFNMLAEFWIKKDSKALLSFAKNDFEGKSKAEFYRQIIQTMGKIGLFKEASQALNDMPMSDLRLDSIRGLAREYSIRDSALALQWANRFDFAEDRVAAQQSLFTYFSRKGDVQLLEKLATTADPELRNRIAAEIGRISGTQNTSNPQQAFDTTTREGGLRLAGSIQTVPITDLANLSPAIRKITATDVRIQAYDAYIGRLLADGTSKAVDWALASPAESKQMAVHILANRWYQIDSEGFSDWVNKLPDGSVRDGALHAMVQQLSASKDADTARIFASKIQDKLTRESAMRSIH